MIINSIIDQDLYKFSMQYAVMKLFPNVKVRYTFIDRNEQDFPDGFAYKLRDEIDSMKELKLRNDERKFFQEKTKSFLPELYFDFLSKYRYNPSEVNIWRDSENKLHVEIEGYWYKTILWEVPLLATISELYFSMTDDGSDFLDAELYKTHDKREFFMNNNCRFSDFGTRRRYSYETQDYVVDDFSKRCSVFNGTSNVHFAHKYDVTPIGTMAHEWIMFHAAKYGFTSANFNAMENWVNVYDGNLGIALTDTYTSKQFFDTFTLKQAKLFDGVRQDSGSPFEFADRTLKFYNDKKIDPQTKTIIFSDSLNCEKVKEINDYVDGRIKCAYGIGTFLTNDVGVKPLNIVIKLSQVKLDDNSDWIDVIKLSDDKGKHTGNKSIINAAKTILRIS